VDQAGRLVTGAGLDGVPPEADVSSRPVVHDLLPMLRRSPEPKVFRSGDFGQGRTRVVGAYAALPESRWVVVTEQPIESAYAQVATMQRTMVGGLLMAFAA